MWINGRLVEARRRSRAWSQAHLAQVANLSLHTIVRIERTNRAHPESIRAIADALDLSTEELTAPATSAGVAMPMASAVSPAQVQASAVPPASGTAEAAVAVKGLHV